MKKRDQINTSINRLRKESSKQYSGNIHLSKIEILKERHYFTIDVPLDGEAPKQYIKAYFYYKNCPRISKPSTWDGYYAKFGGKSYPHESIMEYCINRIGELLGLEMNSTKLVIANGQIRFLSKDFIKKSKILIHGIEILSEYFEDKEFVDEINNDRKNRRVYLTFDVIERAIKHVYPNQSIELLNKLVQLITFDAIVGNNDRHFYNWGVIGDIIKSKTSSVSFAPIYDSARGLLWNQTDSKIIKMYHHSKNNKSELSSYIDRAKPRFSFTDNPNANHFELIEHLVSNNKDYRNIVKNLTSVKKELIVLEKLKAEIYCIFRDERAYLISKILKMRFEKLRNCL